jgi:hypothetical protein
MAAAKLLLNQSGLLLHFLTLSTVRGVGLDGGAVGQHVGEVAGVERELAASVERHAVVGVEVALAPQAVAVRRVHALVAVAGQAVPEGAAVHQAQRVRTGEGDHVVQRQPLLGEELREDVDVPLVRRRQVAGQARPRHRAVRPAGRDGVPEATAVCCV